MDPFPKFRGTVYNTCRFQSVPTEIFAKVRDQVRSGAFLYTPGSCLCIPLLVLVWKCFATLGLYIYKTVLVTICDDILKAMGSQRITAILAIDFSAAFDTES